MRRLSVAVVIFAAACGGSTAPAGPLHPIGLYALARFDGAVVPSCDSARCLRAGSLAIDSAAGPRYVLADTLQSGLVSADTGTWEVIGHDSLVLTPAPVFGLNPPANVATLVGGTLAVTYSTATGFGSDRRVYQRR